MGPRISPDRSPRSRRPPGVLPATHPGEVMNPRDFLAVAEDLLEATREADWRSAVSPAYFAAFLVTVELFTNAGFEVPPAATGHSHVYLRLNNCGNAEVIDAARRL